MSIISHEWKNQKLKSLDLSIGLFMSNINNYKRQNVLNPVHRHTTSFVNAYAIVYKNMVGNFIFFYELYTQNKKKLTFTPDSIIKEMNDRDMLVYRGMQNMIMILEAPCVKKYAIANNKTAELIDLCHKLSAMYTGYVEWIRELHAFILISRPLS